jgi:GTP-binding protein HflX
VAVSARTGQGFPELFDELSTSLRPVRAELELAIPFTEQRTLARLHALGQVLEEDYDSGTHVHLRVLVPPHLRHEFTAFART